MSSGHGTRHNKLRLIRLKNFDDYIDVVVLRRNKTYGSECGCKQLRNRCCSDAIYPNNCTPKSKRRCLQVLRRAKNSDSEISRWIEGIQTTYRPSTVGTTYEYETHRRRTAALSAIVDEGHAI